ncbi:MAG: hemolysin family protein [Sphingobacterium sp.]|uniref:hemolysin family protein n=1 Tax=Sphingobacterium sp. JB170 TaxID=1434842 RepID=UPI00097EAC98|nr:hemolysin family protein [Sphingobacterium sp. JB170]SJN38679.1 Magnesium and cobalt efflux protein CorC [Sphingobacterium sp. JB170]
MLTEILIILCLIVINGILSASEISIVSSRKARLKTAAETSNNAKIALKLKENPNQFLSTIQIGITLIGILTGFFSGGTISKYLTIILQNIPAIRAYSEQISTTVVVLIITYLSLVIGELVPKRIGMAIPEKYAMLVAVPMRVLSRIVKPFVWLLSISTDAIVRILNIKVSKNTVTEEEIKAMVDEGVNSGVIENFEHDFVDRLLVLGDKRAVNLMVHRSNIDCINLKDSFEENKEIIRNSKHSEFPVVDGSFDQVKGVVHVKALMQNILDEKPIDLAKLTYPIPFVNENTSAYNVLSVFRNAKAQLAIVIDEYGIPQGIVSIKDIVRTLFGEMDSIDDRGVSFAFRKREDGSVVVEGRTQLDDFLEYFQISLSEEDQEEVGAITTLGGLVFLTLDHVPEEGEYIKYKGYQLEVIDMDGRRIDKVLITKLATPLNSITENED